MLTTNINWNTILSICRCNEISCYS